MDEAENETPSIKKQIGEHSPAAEKQIHKENAANLTDDEKEHIGIYTGAGYKPLNKELYQKGGANSKLGDHLDHIMSKHKVKKQFHVFTGLKVDPSKEFKKNGDSTTFRHPAFMSTSTTKRVASEFARNVPNKDEGTSERHVLKLHVPEGAHAMSVKDHTTYNDENEILLHRGHHIEIHHTPTIVKDSRGTTKIWHGRIVGHSL